MHLRRHGYGINPPGSPLEDCPQPRSDRRVAGRVQPLVRRSCYSWRARGQRPSTRRKCGSRPAEVIEEGYAQLKPKFFQRVGQDPEPERASTVCRRARLRSSYAAWAKRRQRRASWASGRDPDRTNRRTEDVAQCPHCHRSSANPGPIRISAMPPPLPADRFLARLRPTWVMARASRAARFCCEGGPWPRRNGVLTLVPMLLARVGRHSSDCGPQFWDACLPGRYAYRRLTSRAHGYASQRGAVKPAATGIGEEPLLPSVRQECQHQVEVFAS